MDKIREIIGKDYANTLGIVAYKNGEKFDFIFAGDFFENATFNSTLGSAQRKEPF